MTAQNLLQFVESGLGVIDVADGGTGATSLTGYVKGNGTSPFTTTATIPGDDVSGNISGNAANVTGVVAVANGGTGATNAATARTNLQVPYTFGTGGTSVVAWQAGSNVASGNYCVVGGGQSNTSSGSYSFVGGGYKNTSAVGSVSAGLHNTASGGASVVAGGGIAGTFTVTIGSPGVFAMFRHGLVAGDAIVLETTGTLPSGLASNTTYYVIGTNLGPNLFSVSETPGGSAINTSGSQSGTHTLRSLTARNVASGNGSVVGGGVKNAAGGPQAAVGGGRSNTASGYASAVGGGQYNTGSGYNSAVGGGEHNTAYGTYSAVGGGRENTSSGYQSTVGGGYRNRSLGLWSSVSGGNGNWVSGNYGFVGGGTGNSASGYASAIGGGFLNTTAGRYGFVGAGNSNTASGTYATIPGGTSNTATHQNVFLLGSSLVSDADDTTYVENLRVKGGFNTGVTLGTNAFPTGKVSIRSAIVNLKTVAETTIFTVPTGYMFLIDTVEVVTTSVTSAGAAPTIQFGNTGDSDAYYGPTQVTSNAVGARHISENPQDGAAAGTVITMGVTVASTATAHSGVGIVTGYLLKTS